MADMTLEAETSKTTMDEVRPGLDAALKKEFPGGMMRWSWDGDVLKLSGPGAEGSVVLDGGKLVGFASLKPPASLMQAKIREKMGRVLEAAAG
ncbi:MAG: hypothetical protein SX243_24855 [Acidobacteriota bacterium]|nr:hypothetical protein [Acidobacteriota bacterium]